ncbi:winged helix-turn-helix transcriptional regulator [Halosolutus gelatinilyticus]|uniref:winged helix-turn-helix transcriptional regulator n=1 Tax=Halosolutus gelatinilyticus TaxID=2931975 RepID=UPI001FF21573|nr:winged helix-turn-helix transcriptional regulator [Halosolutus gelatinilyticus]
MTSTDQTESIARTLLGSKWKPRLIVALATDGKTGFGALKRDLDGISNKVLSTNLEELVEYGVVNRDVIQEHPRRVEYELTTAGFELYAILGSMTAWDSAHIEGEGLPTVLLADDDRRLLELFSVWLAAEYDVITTSNGRDALHLLDDSIDVAIFDRNMPELRGEEVAAAIEIERRPPTAILTSKQVSPADVSLPADLLLQKPITKTELHDAIEELRRLDDESPIARDVLARKRRLDFVETHLGSVVTTTPPYRTAEAELERIEAERAAALEAREPWRKALGSSANESGADEREE